MNIKIIGLGGIGSMLSELICRYLNYSDYSGLITLVDGKEYKVKNSERQFFTQFGNKAGSKGRELRSRFKNLTIDPFTEYVTDKNISEVIQNGDIVFVCVDNHETRKRISDYAGTLMDVIIISGGNDWTDGNVQIYSRKGGVKIRPSLTDYHPEIEDPDDRSPEAMSCEELAKSEPQLFFANVSAALLMAWVFYAIFTTGNVPKESEIYFDIAQLSINAVERPVPQI